MRRLATNVSAENFLLPLVFQNQPFRGVLKKSCSENMLQIYRRAPMPKCDFNKVAHRSVISIKLFCNFIEIALRHTCSPVNLLDFLLDHKNTSGWLLLVFGVPRLP